MSSDAAEGGISTAAMAGHTHRAAVCYRRPRPHAWRFSLEGETGEGTRQRKRMEGRREGGGNEKETPMEKAASLGNTGNKYI